MFPAGPCHVGVAPRPPPCGCDPVGGMHLLAANARRLIAGAAAAAIRALKTPARRRIGMQQCNFLDGAAADKASARTKACGLVVSGARSGGEGVCLVHCVDVRCSEALPYQDRRVSVLVVQPAAIPLSFCIP